MDAGGPGRPHQKSRTRKDLLRAASRLMSAGRSPCLEDVAQEAMISRATAYRYFPGIEALLAEAALDVAMPDAESFFAGDASAEPLERLLRADAAVASMIRANEPALRAMLIHSLQQGLAGGGALPVRRNGRTPLIEAALASGRERFAPWLHDRLVKALALVVGTESMIASKDVLGIDDEEADAVRRWMIRALFEAAARKA
ncbi:MAG TPA: TetR/AcrR family transcriptional regulator [Allosphingosinicella sp.]|nr:TetR/AcrR family transcriptional regulator [Allosphingosinicella sp.]